ncbi:TRAP transporter small permease [Oricola thermophila]|uniref:TRAP transporter small permease protein n=1 Tax=Oricola thermophila TaxID=2742145 RepID=A0A6N1V8N6_9HYPH|nr:TRAP transporter small permease [Oricola thermophila]QKV17294.1 TRAP transporter small permease [Oricola thermophila]
MRSLLWKWADRLIGLSAIVGTIGLLVGVVVVLVDVVGREFHMPLTGAQDISQMAMVTMVFGGMAIADRLSAHIAVDVFEGVFPPVINRVTQIIAPIVGAVVFLILARAMWEAAALSRMLNLATNIIFLPKAWFQYMAVVMSVITALAMILRAVDAILGCPRSEYEADTKR